MGGASAKRAAAGTAARLRSAVVLAAAALSFAAFAGAPVEDSRATIPPSPTDSLDTGEREEPSAGVREGLAPREPSAGVREGLAPRMKEQPGDRLATLFYQLQVLQDEVRRLQGIVEEQNYRIERLVQEQRERYVELDERLLALTGANPQEPGEESPVAASPLAPSTEREAYNAAISVVKNAAGQPPSERREAYLRALTMFGALVREFPNGEFTANAYYWMGEAQLYLEELELARQAFVQVVNLFGDHAKVPDALYKLGVVYHQLNDLSGALHYLDRAIAEFPDHTAARLAESYAAELR